MKQKIKSMIKRHRRILAAARLIRNKTIGKKLPPVVSWDQVHNMAAEWAGMLPEFDLIVGIPRAGLFVAEVLAMELGLPLSTPENFMRGEVWQSSRLSLRRNSWEYSRVFVVDDSLGSGETMRRIRHYLMKNFPEVHFSFGCLCLLSKEPVDFLDHVYAYSETWVNPGDVKKFHKGILKARIKTEDLRV